MRFGVMVGGYNAGISLEGYVETARDLERRGFDTMWIPHVFGHDAIGCATLIGSATERIELGTAIVPTYPRHPTAMAQQAVTAGALEKAGIQGEGIAAVGLGRAGRGHYDVG